MKIDGLLDSFVYYLYETLGYIISITQLGSILKFGFQYFIKFLLIITEWKLPNKKFVDAITLTPKAVIIYPHTSYWDFVVMGFIIWSEPELGKNLLCLVNERFYNRFPKIMKICGCMPTTSKETSKGGFITSTVENIKNVPRAKFLISPEGALRKCEWRSGYYWLAKGLNCPIIIIGPDYSIHMIKYVGTYHPTGDYEKDQLEYQENFKKMVPLYPECSFVPIPEPYNPPSAIGWLTLTAFLTPLPTLYYLFLIHPIIGITVGLCMMVSFIYHYTGELCCRYSEPIIVKFAIGVYLLTIIYKDLIKIDFISIFLWSGIAISYYLNMGRKETKYRTLAYDRYHFYFHIFVGFGTCYFLI